MIRSAVLWDTFQVGSPSRAGRRARCLSPKPHSHFWPRKASSSASRDRPPMSRAFRRFEILLPLRFNDGRPVPAEMVAETLLELEQRFGAVSLKRRPYRDSGSTRDSLIATT